MGFLQLFGAPLVVLGLALVAVVIVMLVATVWELEARADQEWKKLTRRSRADRAGQPRR
jgi:Na+-transporting methylmalonyl-CoA/oxaloacetate decarboxylase gamma subunit